MKATIGICQWSIPEQGAEAQLALASKLGLRGVEPDLGKYDSGLILSKPEEQDKYRAWREQYGLVYPAIAVNALCDYGMSQVDAHPVALQAIAKAVETAVALDIPIVQLPSFVKGDIVTDEDFQNTITCMRYACKCAEGTDVIIGSENALPADKQLQMIDAVASERFKIYWDTRNLFAMKDLDTVTILKTMLPHLCQTHIKDGVDNGPSTLLGQGNSGYFESMQVFKEAGYEGWMLLENNYTAIAKALDITPEVALREDIKIALAAL